MTENRKWYKPCGYIKSYVKDKYALPTYEAISPEISTEIELKTRVIKYQLNHIWIVWYHQKEKYVLNKLIKDRLRIKTKEWGNKLFI